MLFQSGWKRRGQSEFVKDNAGREYEIATFEGRRSPLDPFTSHEPFQAVPFGRKVRASVFLKGGTVRFTVDTVAQFSDVDRALEAVRQEARRRLALGDWEEVASYYVPVQSEA